MNQDKNLEAGEETSSKPQSDITQVNDDELVLLPIVITTNLPNNHHNNRNSSSSNCSTAPTTPDHQAAATNATSGSSGAALRSDEVAPNHIAWSVLDSKDGRLLCSGSKRINNRPGELAAAIDELSSQIGTRNFLPITCGPLTLRQNLHPAAFRASIELADSFYRYADLIGHFWSSREQAKEEDEAETETEADGEAAHAECFLDQQQYEQLQCQQHQFTATSANYCYCCDTTYYAHHTATLRPDGQMSFDLYPPVSSSQPTQMYQQPAAVAVAVAAAATAQPHLNNQQHQTPREQVNPNSGLRLADQLDRLQANANTDKDTGQDDQEVITKTKPYQSEGGNALANEMPTRDDSAKTTSEKSHDNDAGQINLAPYSADMSVGDGDGGGSGSGSGSYKSEKEEEEQEVQVDEEEEPSMALDAVVANAASSFNISNPSACDNNNIIRSVSSGSNYSRKNSNLNFSLHPLSNTEAERNEMQQVDEILKFLSIRINDDHKEITTTTTTNELAVCNNLTSADEIVASNKLTADQSDKTDVELIEQDAQKSLSLVKLIESMRLVIERMLNEGHRFELGPIETIKRRLEVGLCTSDTNIGDSTVVRARGLPWQATEQDIANFFTGLDITKGGVGLCLSKQGRRNGEALIRFDSQEHRMMALARHKHFMGSRYIEVYRASGDDFLSVVAGYNNKAQAFLSRGPQVIIRMRGLPFTCTPKQVIDFFGSPTLSGSSYKLPAASSNGQPQSSSWSQNLGCPVFGNEDGILFVKNHDDKPTGDAFVLFASEEIAQRALQKHHQNIGSRYVELFRSTASEVQQVLSISIDHQTSNSNSNNIKHQQQQQQQQQQVNNLSLSSNGGRQQQHQSYQSNSSNSQFRSQLNGTGKRIGTSNSSNNNNTSHSHQPTAVATYAQIATTNKLASRELQQPTTKSTNSKTTNANTTNNPETSHQQDTNNKMKQNDRISPTKVNDANAQPPVSNSYNGRQHHHNNHNHHHYTGMRPHLMAQPSHPEASLHHHYHHHHQAAMAAAAAYPAHLMGPPTAAPHPIHFYHHNPMAGHPHFSPYQLPPHAAGPYSPMPAAGGALIPPPPPPYVDPSLGHQMAPPSGPHMMLHHQTSPASSMSSASQQLAEPSSAASCLGASGGANGGATSPAHSSCASSTTSAATDDATSAGESLSSSSFNSASLKRDQTSLSHQDSEADKFFAVQAAAAANLVAPAAAAHYYPILYYYPQRLLAAPYH